MRDLFKTDFIHDVMMKPSKIVKGTGIRMDGKDYMFLSAKIHSFGALTEAFGIEDIKVSGRRKGSGELVKAVTLHNIFTGEVETVLVTGQSDLDYITWPILFLWGIIND